MADESPATGAAPADPGASPPPSSYSTYAREADAADVARARPAPRPDVPAASSPAIAEDQRASTDATPEIAASEPAKPVGDKSPRNLDTRSAEVDAKIAELKQKLAIKRQLEEELRARDAANTKPASDPAQPTKGAWERYKHLPGAPKVEDFETYEDFLDARADFIVERRLEARDQESRAEAESRGRMQSVQQTISGFHARLQQAREADPALDSKIHPELIQIVPGFALRPGERFGPENAIAQAVVESEAAMPLLVHFSTPDGQKEWAELMQAPTPAAMLRKFGRIEARFVSTGSPAVDAKAAPAKPVTSAPAPPTTLGRQPHVSPDRAAAAVKSGDFRAYRDAADAADLATLRR